MLDDEKLPPKINLCKKRGCPSNRKAPGYVPVHVLYLISLHNISQPLYVGNHVSLSLLQDGTTPLMAASFKGHVEVVRILIGSQAQLNSQNKV